MQHSANTISCGVMSRTQTFRLGAMDKVRLGRALGYGARHAAKSLISAADAATSPDPNPRPRVKTATVHPVAQVVETVRQVSQAKAHAKKQVGRAVLGPLKTFSSVIWLQVTGTFFGLFALTMGGAVVRHRDYFRLPIGSEDGRKIYFYLLVFVIFAYFTVSNFVRANRRQKQ
jgi:hypothetical protein